MKRSLYVVPFLFLIFSTANAQMNHPFWGQYRCAPGTKTVRQEVAIFVEKNGNYEEQERHLSSLISFSQDGYTATIENFQPDGSLNLKMVFSYDPTKNQGRSEFFDNHQTLTSYIIRIFEPSGRESEQITYDRNDAVLGRAVFVIGSDGSTETHRYNADGLETARSTSTYNSANGAGQLDTTDFDATGNVSGKDSILHIGGQQSSLDQYSRTVPVPNAGAAPTAGALKVEFITDYTFDSRHSVVKAFVWSSNSKNQTYRPFSVLYATVTYY